MPLIPSREICTFEAPISSGSSDSCFAKTTIRGGKTENVYYITNANDRIFLHLHNLNLKRMYKTLQAEGKDYADFLQAFLSHVRVVILISIIAFDIHMNLSPSVFSVASTLTSLVGVPLSKWLPKEIIYHIIKRNISSRLKKRVKAKGQPF